MNGFSVRTAAQGDRAARDLQQIADGVEDAGLLAYAHLLRSVALQVGTLARNCARDPDGVTAERIAESTSKALTALATCVVDLRGASLTELASDVEEVAQALWALNRDAHAGEL